MDTFLEGASPGLVGTVAFQLIDDETKAIIIARTKEGIYELPEGSGIYHKKITAPATPGTYSLAWDNGVVGPETSATDILVVTGVLPSEGGTSLVTVAQVLRSKGEVVADQSATDIEALEESILAASVAIRSFTGRAFGVPLVTETRSFEYEGDEFVDIDDAQKITKVAYKFTGSEPAEVASTYWRAEPQEGPPYTYLFVPSWTNVYSSEMGFTYNLDVYTKEHRVGLLIPLIEVTGTYGWAEVPADVQRAAVLTAVEFSTDPSSFASESIAGYSYAKAIRQGTGSPADLAPTAIPGRAQDLLWPYLRFNV